MKLINKEQKPLLLFQACLVVCPGGGGVTLNGKHTDSLLRSLFRTVKGMVQWYLINCCSFKTKYTLNRIKYFVFRTISKHLQS